MNDLLKKRRASARAVEKMIIKMTRSPKAVEAKKEDVMRAFHIATCKDDDRSEGRAELSQMAKDARRSVRGLLLRWGLDHVLYEEGQAGVARRDREAREAAYKVPRSPEHVGEIYGLAVGAFTHGGRAAARERIEVWATETGTEVSAFLAQYGLDAERYGAVQRADNGLLIAA